MTQTSGAFVSAERRGAICQMGHRWKNALANNELSDVEFAVGRQYGQVKTFRAHRLTLSISSDVFHTMFNGSLAERAGKAIEIPDILPDAFSNLLSYIYTGSVENMKEENALPTLYCADKYDLPWLAELCTDFVVDELDADNCLLYLEHALRWTPDCDPVVEKCWDEVDASSHDVLQSQHFLTLERTTLELILQRSTLSAEENAIYVAVEQWATAACARKNLTPSPANRRRMLGSALYRVRFPLMNDEQLAKGPVQSALLNDSEVRSLYLCKHANKDALEFSKEPRQSVMCSIGSRYSYKINENIFMRYTNGYWYPVIVFGRNRVDELWHCNIAEYQNSGGYSRPKRTVRAADILKRGRPVEAYIDGEYKEATYGAQRAGQHTVNVAGRECCVQLAQLKIASKHVDEWEAARK